MKNWIRSTCAAMTLGIALTAGMSTTNDAQAAGLLEPIGGAGSALSIRTHKVAVKIEDGYAITQVDQVFKNPSSRDMEATYRFPVPDKGAVSEFTVWIDGKPVIGEVLEKKQAQQVYDEEKAAGRETGIATKNKHYSFEMRVSPVRAGQDTRVRLVYMQPVDIDTGIGRYVYPLEDGKTDDAAVSFWTENTSVEENFAFNLDLRSSYPVTGARVPAHPQAGIVQLNDKEWQVRMASGAGASAVAQSSVSAAPLTNAEIARLEKLHSNHGNAASLDKDIVVYWRLAPDLPGSVDLVTFKQPGEQKGTFMMTLTPGDDLAPITEGRDWMFVLDTSGSMQGQFATLTAGVQQALGTLANKDRFRIVRFSNDASEITRDWVDASEANVRYWSNQLAGTQVGGGTNLFAGTKAGLKALDNDRTSAIVLVTDGVANVGTTEKKYFLELMKKYDVRLFTAVMGNGANRPLLEAMTEVSNGFSISVSNSDDIVGKLIEFTSKATHEAMHGIKLKINGVKTTDLTPEVTTTLYRGEQLTVFGHYWGTGDATVSLTGKVSGEKKQYQTTFQFPDINERNPELERLWAYAKTQDLQNMIDYLGDDSEFKSAIVDVALEHSLVTDYTSMVVIRDEQFDARGIERLNKQRRATETAAASARASQGVQTTRVDQHQPAFSAPRASHGSNSSGGGNGGGAMTWEIMLLVLFLVGGYIRAFSKARAS